ncbi:hypothetical protein KBD08_01655, partial [Candidatus Babeliales bacterium]|nr:hypothetical protein [Candidatus Babeliales bacterium]
MKRILLVGLLTGVGVVQGSFNPLLLKGTTEALIQAADALKKSEPVAQGKAAKTKKQVVPQGAAVAQRSLTDVEKKLYEDCAPFWGLMYLEKGIAEQWYRLSPKYMYQDFSKAQIEFLVSRKIDIENNSLEKLLGQMYHIGGGQFAVTNATDNIAKYLKPKNIGDILRIINQSLSQALFDKKNLQQQLLDYFKVSLKSELSERGYTKFQPAYLNRFLVPLVDCIAECQQPNSRYPKSTPQHLLISYM